MKKEFNQKAFSEFKESVVSTRQRIINVMASSNMVMCQTLTENAANNFLKECIDNNISVELNVGSHESIESFMDYVARLYHAKGLALEDTDEPSVNDMVKYYHICQCDAIIYQNDEATDEELFNDFDVVPLDMLNDEKLKEYKILFETFEKYVAYYNKEDKSELLYDLFKQKRKQSIKVDDDIRQIMYVLIDRCNIDEEDVTRSGNLIFRNNYDEKSVKFCGKDGEYYHFITSGYYGYDDEYEECDYFVKIENGAAYTYEDGIIHSLLICLDKTENGDFYIKNGTEYIYNSAFEDCNFNNVIIPDSVGSVSKDEFLPSNIKNITLKSRKTGIYDKEDECFRKIINLEKSELESLIKEDGSLVIPNNITEIPDCVFKGCESLTSVVIPNSVTNIGKLAFDECSGLTSITIPASVISIGRNAFNECNSLTKVNYTGTIDQWSQISFDGSCANPLCYAANLYINGALVTEINLTTATKISNYAFYNCSSLISVTIGNSVINIEGEAFEGCSSLTKATIGSSVKSIGDNAFKDCSSLTYNIKDGLKYLGNNNNPYLYLAGVENNSIVSVIIDNGCKLIGYRAFEDCDSLTSVEIPNNVISIGNGAFSGCSKLTSITIPNGITSIGYFTFNDCDSLTSVVIGDSVESIGSYAFRCCKSLTSIEMPDGVTSIGESAFSNCESLMNIKIPDGVTSIGDYTFYRCKSLESVIIPDSVINIAESAFEHCDSLK